MKSTERTERESNRGFILSVAGIIVVGLLLWWLGARVLPQGTTSGEGTSNPGTSSTDFSVSGNTAALISPGVTSSLDLEFVNIHDTALRVDGLIVTLTGVDAPNARAGYPCSRDDFTVTQIDSDVSFVLPARSTSTLSGLKVDGLDRPRVSMINTTENQDGCKGASLTLTYSASGDPSS